MLETLVMCHSLFVQTCDAKTMTLKLEMICFFEIVADTVKIF